MKKVIPITSLFSLTDIVTVSENKMELIIKPTELCNFKCTFCSSTNLTEDTNKLLDLESIFRFLKKYPNTSTIIVNGGDPLMVPIKYYWELIDYLDKNNLKTRISFTSNLWAFKVKPDKWKDLFKHPRMGITTSFNYGDTRRVTSDIIFTEEMFWEISNLMLEHVGYRPDFISVINDDNEDTAIANVELAKKMGVECKLNHAMSSGAQGTPFQLSKIYAIYVELYKRNLWQWEYNTKLMIKRLSKGASGCPQLRNCDDTIRCLQPDGDYYSCGSFADDKAFPIDFEKEMIGETAKPLQNEITLLSLKNECFQCPMFDICNGCRKTISDMKKANIVEQHCTLMKQISVDILEINHENRHLVNINKEEG